MSRRRREAATGRRSIERRVDPDTPPARLKMGGADPDPGGHIRHPPARQLDAPAVELGLAVTDKGLSASASVERSVEDAVRTPPFAQAAMAG